MEKPDTKDTKAEPFLTIGKNEGEKDKWSVHIEDYNLGDLYEISGVLGHTLSMFTNKVLKEHHKEEVLDDYQIMLINSFVEGFGYKSLANSIGLMFLLQNKYGIKIEDTAKQLEKALDEEINSIKEKRRKIRKEGAEA